MTKTVTYHGAIILLNILCLVQLLMLTMGGEAYAADPTSLPINPMEAFPTIIAIFVIDAAYLFCTKRYGSPERQTKDV